MIVSSSFTAKSIVYQPKIPLRIQDGKASPLSDYICTRKLDEGEGGGMVLSWQSIPHAIHKAVIDTM